MKTFDNVAKRGITPDDLTDNTRLFELYEGASCIDSVYFEDGRNVDEIISCENERLEAKVFEYIIYDADTMPEISLDIDSYIFEDVSETELLNFKIANNLIENMEQGEVEAWIDRQYLLKRWKEVSAEEYFEDYIENPRYF
jgi:hypothetical protein